MTRFDGQLARRLIWKHNLAVKDSIHVATALDARVGEMHTTDDKLLKLAKSGPLCVDGYEPLTIQNPGWIDPASPEANGVLSLLTELDGDEG